MAVPKKKNNKVNYRYSLIKSAFSKKLINNFIICNYCKTTNFDSLQPVKNKKCYDCLLKSDKKKKIY
jgi:hypothetical protein